MVTAFMKVILIDNVRFCGIISALARLCCVFSFFAAAPSAFARGSSDNINVVAVDLKQPVVV